MVCEVFICPQLLSEAIIHECIQRLLKSSSDGESLECFAKLMTTIGKELDHDKGQVSMTDCLHVHTVTVCISYEHLIAFDVCTCIIYCVNYVQYVCTIYTV